MARLKWKPGMVRSVFALRAEGKTPGMIAEIMGTSPSVIYRIITRQVHGNVPINQQTLDKVEQVIAKGRRKPVKKPKAIDGTKGSGVLQQAMKTADPAYSMAPKGDPRTPAATHEDLNLEPPQVPNSGVRITKAEALQSVLSNVALANKARADVNEAQLVVEMLKKEAKQLEDATFTLITELKEMGFTPTFLNMFLDECGLCTDGSPTKA